MRHGGIGGYWAGQCTVTALVFTVCHAPLAWNSGPMFLSVSGVAKREQTVNKLYHVSSMLCFKFMRPVWVASK